MSMEIPQAKSVLSRPLGFRSMKEISKNDTYTHLSDAFVLKADGGWGREKAQEALRDEGD